MNKRQDRARNDVPIFANRNWDDWLKIQLIAERLIVITAAKVEVILKWNANERSHRILLLFRKFLLALGANVRVNIAYNKGNERLLGIDVEFSFAWHDPVPYLAIPVLSRCYPNWVKNGSTHSRSEQYNGLAARPAKNVNWVSMSQLAILVLRPRSRSRKNNVIIEWCVLSGFRSEQKAAKQRFEEPLVSHASFCCEPRRRDEDEEERVSGRCSSSLGDHFIWAVRQRTFRA